MSNQQKREGTIAIAPQRNKQARKETNTSPSCTPLRKKNDDDVLRVSCQWLACFGATNFLHGMPILRLHGGLAAGLETPGLLPPCAHASWLAKGALGTCAGGRKRREMRAWPQDSTVSETRDDGMGVGLLLLRCSSSSFNHTNDHHTHTHPPAPAPTHPPTHLPIYPTPCAQALALGQRPRPAGALQLGCSPPPPPSDPTQAARSSSSNP